MEYRKLPKGTEQISMIGMGTSSIGMAGEKEIEATMVMALENGINYFDMASSDAEPFEAFGNVLAGTGKISIFRYILEQNMNPENMDGPQTWIQ